MPRLFLLLVLLNITSRTYSQAKRERGSLGLSFPVIYNNPEASYYQLGSPTHSNGNALSYGLHFRLFDSNDNSNHQPYITAAYNYYIIQVFI